MTNDRKMLWAAGAVVVVLLIGLAWIVSSGREAEAVLVADLEAERVARQEATDAFVALEAAGGDLATVEARRDEVDAQRTELEALIVELETRAADTRTALDEELTALAARRDAALEETQVVEADLEQLRTIRGTENAALAQIGERRDAIAAEVDRADARLTEVESRLTEQLTELSEVGARLEDARTQEADLRATLAALQAEAATIAEELADAEARAQTARAAEDEARQAAEALEAATVEMQTRRTTLTEEIAGLEEDQRRLREAVDAAEAQRAQVQTDLAALTERLAARSDALASVETRIVESLGEDVGPGAEAARPDGASGGFAPKRYRSGDVVATFARDGTFRMANEASGESLAGQYVQDAGLLILSEVEGDLRAGIPFPLTCALEETATGFRLDAPEEGACGPLVGAGFDLAPQ